jgi:hypothetical protein
MGSLNHDWNNATAPSGYTAAPPGYGQAQPYQRGHEAKRRRVDDNGHAVSWLYTTREPC